VVSGRKWIAYVEGNPAFHYNGKQCIQPDHGGGRRRRNPVAITDSIVLNTSPIWIQGRRALLFVSDKEGGRDIYQVALRSSGTPAGAAVR
jgi:hypothetical protein